MIHQTKWQKMELLLSLQMLLSMQMATKHYRFYQNSTTTITSTAGNITKIEFTCDIDKKGKYGSNGFDGTEGYTFTEDKKEGTWVGNATSVQFAAKYQVRASKIVIPLVEVLIP